MACVRHTLPNGGAAEAWMLHLCSSMTFKQDMSVIRSKGLPACWHPPAHMSSTLTRRAQGKVVNTSLHLYSCLWFQASGAGGNQIWNCSALFLGLLFLFLPWNSMRNGPQHEETSHMSLCTWCLQTLVSVESSKLPQPRFPFLNLPLLIRITFFIKLRSNCSVNLSL